MLTGKSSSNVVVAVAPTDQSGRAVQWGFHQDFQLHTCRNQAKGNNNNADGLLSDGGVVFVSSVVGGA